jgi:hypothetical protein
MRRLIPLLLTLAASPPLEAARPFVTDDARVVDPDGYQVETFYKRQRAFRESESWVLPAINPRKALGDGKMEFTLGRYWVDSDSPGDNQATIAQVKSLLKPLETNGQGFALTLGTARVAPFQQARAWNPYVNGITSVSFADDRFILHANLGGVRDRPANRSRATWGTGAEIMLLEPRLIGIVETYGQSGEKPTFHTGLRIWVVPNRWQVDTTVGRQRSGPERRFYTIGMRFLW